MMSTQSQSVDRPAFVLSTPDELRRHPVVECSDPMVSLQEAAPGLLFDPVLKETQELLHTDLMFARTGVAERLVAAQAILTKLAADCQVAGVDAQPRLVVGYAYRLPEVQERYFEMARAHVREQCPNLLTEEEVDREAYNFVNIPELAGHPAGAAVDVTLADRTGAHLEMGTRFLDVKDGALIRVDAFTTRDTEIHDRRMLLRAAMLGAGFAPFNGEWWHFSFGDREWAAYYGKRNAIYGSVPRTEVEALIAR